MKKTSVRITLVLLVVINLALITRLMVESVRSEDVCLEYMQGLVQKSQKDVDYWQEKIPPEEYTARERQEIRSSDGYITREFRELLKCEQKRNAQIKYFIFF